MTWDSWGYGWDYDEPTTRDDMIRELVEGCDSLADIRAIAREMRAELKRQKIMRRAERRRWAEPIAPTPPYVVDGEGWVVRDPVRDESLRAYHARLQARGPVVMSPHDIEQMKREVAAVEWRQMMHRAMELNKVWPR